VVRAPLATLAVALALLPAPPAQALAPPPVDKTVVLGHSVRGTPLYAYRRNAINANRRVLVIGSIHGDEPAGVQVARYLRDHRGGFQRDVEVWVVLALNPDGLAAHTRWNAHHVDLNRNFSYRWRYDATNPRYFSGPSAESEPETRALAAFDRTYRPRTEVIFHQPYGVVDLSNSTALASALMAASTGLPRRALGTRSGSNAGYLQQEVRGAIALTTELPARPTSQQLNGAINGTYRVANSR
jgi:protein MpaA